MKTYIVAIMLALSSSNSFARPHILDCPSEYKRNCSGGIQSRIQTLRDQVIEALPIYGPYINIESQAFAKLSSGDQWWMRTIKSKGINAYSHIDEMIATTCDCVEVVNELDKTLDNLRELTAP